MPPARSTSSMCHLPAGLTLHRCGVRVRNLVDALKRIIDAALVREGQRVQDGIGRAAHGHIEREGIVDASRH